MFIENDPGTVANGPSGSLAQLLTRWFPVLFVTLFWIEFTIHNHDTKVRVLSVGNIVSQWAGLKHKSIHVGA